MALDRLLKIILVTLPFTNSVTLPIGFPLKIYEGVGVLALGTLAMKGSINLGKHHRIPFYWTLFLFGSLFPSAWGLYEILEMDLSMLNWAHGRFNPLVNTAFHYFYLAFDIGLLALFIHALVQSVISLKEFCKFWLWGSILAVVYGLALNLVILLGLSPNLLMRWDKVQFMNVGGFNLARTGPFEEGNYFGLYLLASMVITLWAWRRWDDRFFKLSLPLLMVGVLMTASPAALLGVLAIIFVAMMSKGTSPVLRAWALAGAFIVGGVLVLSGLFQTVILDKFSLLLVGGVTDVTNVSLVQRMNESYHAWQIFLDHPFGVGMSNYGYFFGYYDDLYVWLVSDFVSFKRIANNIYLEVLCEHGALLFLLFIGILLGMMKRLLHSREFIPAIGLLLISGYFLAFPTFRISLIWVFWSFCVFLGTDEPPGKINEG